MGSEESFTTKNPFKQVKRSVNFSLMYISIALKPLNSADEISCSFDAGQYLKELSKLVLVHIT